MLTYPVTEWKQEDNVVFVRAGIEGVNEKHQRWWKGIAFHMALPDEKEVEYFLSFLGHSKQHGHFQLIWQRKAGERMEDGHLEAFYDEVIHDLPRELFSEWTGLSAGETDDAIEEGIHLRTAVRITAAMPRRMVVSQERIRIYMGPGGDIDWTGL